MFNSLLFFHVATNLGQIEVFKWFGCVTILGIVDPIFNLSYRMKQLAQRYSTMLYNLFSGGHLSVFMNWKLSSLGTQTKYRHVINKILTSQRFRLTLTYAQY